MGGENDNPTEQDDGGHAEVVEVVFDPARLSYRGLLEVFFQVHRPDLDQDIVGSLYRSEIFCTSPEQRTVAEDDPRRGRVGPLARQDGDQGQRGRGVLGDGT